MIRLFREALARHYHRVAHAQGTAILLAQIRRDWPRAGRHMVRMHAAQAKRDALLQGRTPVCCNHNCDEGRTCPVRR